MAIKGSLKEVSLADVLQLLALGQKTGCLSVNDGSNLGYIYFDRGRIAYASIVNRRDRLGDILVKNGEVTQDQLENAIGRQSRERDKRVGEILVQVGAISRQKLERYMRIQIEEAVFFLFTWSQGSFHFESDVRASAQDFLVSINPESLLLEGARRVDEWSVIEKKIPSFDIIFSIDDARLAASDITLTDAQQRIVPLIDGARDVKRIIEDSGMGEFEVGKALYGLISVGFLHRRGRSETIPVAKTADARVDEHRNLGVAFYRTGMFDEAQREFRRVAELRPSDGSAFFYLGLIAAKQSKWTEAIAAFGEARERGGDRASVLYNLALCYERAGQLDDAEAAYADAAQRAGQEPRVLMGWGIVALHRGDYDVAAARLDQAREAASDNSLSPLWFWARSLAAAAADDLDAAERALHEGLERHPDHTVLRNNLAVVLETQGRFEDAEAALREALRDDPSLPHLSKNLGDLLYRAGRYDEAWDAYQRVVKLQPELGDDVYFKLGNIAYKRLDRQAAGGYWRKSIELNPAHELARTNLDTMSALA